MSLEMTIGICAYNEELNIGKLLKNILIVQQLPKNSEILVVCSGCTDNTVDIVQNFQKKDSRIKIIVEEKRNGKATAINKILSKANGKLILFISADTLPNRGCFLKLFSKFEDSTVGIVCGKPIPTNDLSSKTGKIVNLLWSFHDRVFTQLNKANQLRHASEVYCIRKGIVKEIPKDTVNDDAYIALTARKLGWKIKYEPKGIVSITGPQTISDYLRQRRRILWGHHQVKKLTGESPQYLVHMIPLNPLNGLKLTLMLFYENEIWTVLTFLLLELIINYLSVMDSLLGKSYTKWEIATTTKQ